MRGPRPRHSLRRRARRCHSLRHAKPGERPCGPLNRPWDARCEPAWVAAVRATNRLGRRTARCVLALAHGRRCRLPRSLHNLLDLDVRVGRTSGERQRLSGRCLHRRQHRYRPHAVLRGPHRGTRDRLLVCGGMAASSLPPPILPALGGSPAAMAAPIRRRRWPASPPHRRSACR